MTYQRFWDLHVTANDGRSDAGPEIAPLHDYKMARHAWQQSLTLITTDDRADSKRLLPVPLAGRSLPAAGYVTSAARISEIHGNQCTGDFEALVAWIDGAGQRGKLRVIAHGDGHGSFQALTGSSLVWWLCANDLGAARSLTSAGKRSEGLATLSLNVCMSARHGAEAATRTADGRYQPAEHSLLHAIATELGKAGCPGIEVTGTSNFSATSLGPVVGVPGSARGNTLIVLGDPPVGTEWPRIDRPNETGVRVRVPSGFRVESTAGTAAGVIHVPAGFVFEPIQKNRARHPSMGWEIYVAGRPFVHQERVAIPEIWIVDEARRRITPPHGWTITSFGEARGGELYRAAAGSYQRFAKSPYKVRHTSS